MLSRISPLLLAAAVTAGCAANRVALEPRADHAAYIQSWLKVLQNDKRAIFSAESQSI